MHIEDVLMHRKAELVWRGLIDQLGVGKATSREMFWRAEWTSPMATATTIQNQASEREWRFH
jgi:hypothetical protein